MPKTILITGGAGFIAHHVVDYILENRDYNVTLLDRLDYSGNLNRVADLLEKKYKNNPVYTSRVRSVFHDLKAEINPMVSDYIGDVDIIFHLAAGSHVDRSISNPLDFVMDNVVGTCNILNYARNLPHLEKFLYFSTDEVFGPAPAGVNYKERDRYNSGNPYSASKAGAEELCVAFENTYRMPIVITHCHDSETLCWSEKGIVPITDLSVGENVWTLKDNCELELQPIEEIVYSDYAGKMINFDSNGFSFKVTPNHRMLTKLRHGEKVFSIKIATDLVESLNKGQRHYIPNSGIWNGKWEEEIDISKFIDQSSLHHNTKPIPTIFKTEDFMSFVGWFISEGSFGSVGTGTISIANKNPLFRKEIISLINRMGFRVSNNPDTESWTNIQINSITFQKFLEEQFGRGCENKKIPKWILDFDQYYLSFLYDSLIMGDGSDTPTYTRYYSKSKALCEQVAEIAIKLGHSALVSSRITSPVGLGRADQEILSYYVSIRENNCSTLEQNHVSFEENYNGKIWCVRTKNGNFFISRNGKIACSGNTMNVLGQRQHPEKFLPMCIKKIQNGETVTIHANKEKTKAGSRFYIHALDVAGALIFILENNPSCPSDFGGAKIPKFNIVGSEELDNLQLATIIANSLGKELKYEFVDFHSSRPGHDLRYSLDGDLLKSCGWKPSSTITNRVDEIVKWYVANPEWLYGRKK